MPSLLPPYCQLIFILHSNAAQAHKFFHLKILCVLALTCATYSVHRLQLHVQFLVSCTPTFSIPHTNIFPPTQLQSSSLESSPKDTSPEGYIRSRWAPLQLCSNLRRPGWALRGRKYHTANITPPAKVHAQNKCWPCFQWREVPPKSRAGYVEWR